MTTDEKVKPKYTLNAEALFAAVQRAHEAAERMRERGNSIDEARYLGIANGMARVLDYLEADE